MQIVGEFTISSQVQLWLVSILFLGISWLTGSLVNPLRPPKSPASPFTAALNVFFGFLIIGAFTAVYVTSGHTSMVFVIVMFGFLLWQKQKKEGGGWNWKVNLPGIFRDIVLGISCFTLLYTLNLLFYSPDYRDGLLFFLDDLNFYANCVSHLMQEGRETLPAYSFEGGDIQVPYHFPELWFSGAITSLTGVSSFSSFVMIYRPILLFVLLLVFVDFIRERGFIAKIAASAFLLLATALPYPEVSNIGLPWYADLSFSGIPLFFYTGALPVTAGLALAFTAFLRGEKALYFWLISLSGLVNPLFLPIPPLLFGVLCISIIMREKMAWTARLVQGITRKDLFWPAIFSLLPVLIYFLSGFNLERRGVESMYSVSNLIVGINIFVRLILATLVFLVFYWLGFRWWIRSDRQFISHGILFLVFSLLTSATLFNGFGHNVFQIQRISWIAVVIFFGSAGLLHLGRGKNFYYALLFFCASYSISLIVVEYRLGFFPLVKWNHHESPWFIKKSDVEATQDFFLEHGSNGAYFNEGSTQRLLYLPSFMFLGTMFDNVKISRVNIMEADTLPSNKYIFNKTIHRMVMKNDGPPEEFYQAVLAKLKTDWLVTIRGREDFFIPVEVKKQFPRSREIGILIFHTSE